MQLGNDEIPYEKICKFICLRATVIQQYEKFFWRGVKMEDMGTLPLSYRLQIWSRIQKYIDVLSEPEETLTANFPTVPPYIIGNIKQFRDILMASLSQSPSLPEME